MCRAAVCHQVTGPLSAGGWLAGLADGLASEPASLPEPARMAGLDITERLGRDRETQLVSRLLQLLRERAAAAVSSVTADSPHGR